MAAWLLWLIAAGLFAAGEVVSLDLVLLMFAGGALGGMSVALLGGATAFQLIAFIAVSALLLAVVRPIATKHLTNRTPLQLDGVDTLIGRTAKVTREIDVSGGTDPDGGRRVERPQPAQRRELRRRRDGPDPAGRRRHGRRRRRAGVKPVHSW